MTERRISSNGKETIYSGREKSTKINVYPFPVNSFVIQYDKNGGKRIYCYNAACD